MKTQQSIYAALGILAVLGGGLYLTTQDKKADAQRHTATAASADLPTASLPKDDADKITKVEVSSPDKDDKAKSTKVTLEKKGDDWQITAPISAKANGANVKSLVDNLKELKVKEVIERGTNSYAQYDLDDQKAVHVTAYKGDGKAIELYFGKSGSRGQMARVGGRDGVVSLSAKPGESYSSYLYTRDVKGWRDNSILKFEDANAIQVEVTNKNGLFSFSKNGDKWSYSLTKREKDGKLGKPEKEWKKFDEGKVKDLLRNFKGLTADDYGTDKDRADSGVDKAEETGGVVHIKLKDNAGDIVVRVGKVSKGTSHWAVKEGNDILYAIPGYVSDWATADVAKFEKSDKPAAGGGAPPPGLPPGMGMPEPGGGEE